MVESKEAPSPAATEALEEDAGMAGEVRREAVAGLDGETELEDETGQEGEPGVAGGGSDGVEPAAEPP